MLGVIPQDCHLNTLKKLVSEPSNIIYPESFSVMAKKNINQSNVYIKILKKDKLKKIGLNCLLAVNQGIAKQQIGLEFSKKKYKTLKISILKLTCISSINANKAKKYFT